jgi:hypothetical protein
MNVCLMVGVTSLLAACGTATTEQLAQVKAGKLKEARASWWGFDKEDATFALQAAIDSRVPRLVVDNRGAPWVTDRLTCVSDQEIVFEEGVEVLAKKGAFTGKSDALLSLIGVTNVTLRGPGATLRMRRADYDAPPYAKAEWRHVLSIKSSANIQILGLTLAESGGDGIYLGCVKAEWPNRDVLIKDVICDKNYRQGISVISAENLLIENTVMRETAGTSPAAGIDFEPNSGGERLKNCVMRNCVTENNEGDGYEFYLPNLTRLSEPVSIRIENCRSTHDRVAVRVIAGNGDEEAVRGELTFSGCLFEKARRNGVVVGRKSAFGLALTFEQCVVSDCAEGTNGFPDILLQNRIEDEWPVGGVRFNRFKVKQPDPRPWIVWQNNTTVADPVADLTGRVTVEQGGDRKDVALTPEWVAQTFPPRFTVRVPRVTGDLAKVKVTDRSEGMIELSPFRLRRSGTYVFAAKAGAEVILIGAQSQVGKYAVSSKPLIVLSPSGKTVKKVPLPTFKDRTEVRFAAVEGGFYRLLVDVGANAFTLLEASVPVAFDATQKAVSLIASTGSLFVPVPQATGVFAFGVAGEGEGEAVQVTVLDPAGQIVWTKDAISQMERFTANGGQGAESGLWQIKVARPSRGGFEDFHVEVLGVPGYLFLCGERYWE